MSRGTRDSCTKYRFLVQEVILDGLGAHWSEYMSLLFVLWSDRRSHDIIEERGFFPDVLKNAMSINRNMHGEKWRYE